MPECPRVRARARFVGGGGVQGRGLNSQNTHALARSQDKTSLSGLGHKLGSLNRIIRKRKKERKENSFWRNSSRLEVSPKSGAAGGCRVPQTQECGVQRESGGVSVRRALATRIFGKELEKRVPAKPDSRVSLWRKSEGGGGGGGVFPRRASALLGKQ